MILFYNSLLRTKLFKTKCFSFQNTAVLQRFGKMLTIKVIGEIMENTTWNVMKINVFSMILCSNMAWIIVWFVGVYDVITGVSWDDMSQFISCYPFFEGNVYLISCQKGSCFVSSYSNCLLLNSSFLGHISLQFVLWNTSLFAYFSFCEVKETHDF